MKKLLIALTLMLTMLYANMNVINDPYKEIDYFVLDNGLQVYLLSNKKATNTQISMEINVGWDIENNENYGLSHLVEHMVFRDKRIAHRDYLDYLIEEGASDVNGYTTRYDTELVAKIDSNKSYWITKIFAQMIFDKDVDSEDIEIEKGAVQVEIGEKVWYDRAMAALGKIKDIFPPSESLYITHFGLSEPKDLPDYYTEKVNNKNFTLEEVMHHYETYYYPSNMILKVVGNFDTVKMHKLISSTYGKIKNTGTKRTYRPKRNATLSHKPYVHFEEGTGSSSGYIGVQYLFDDCQKHIILSSFMKYVSTKIQQKLRNQEGKSYGVSTYNFQSRGAGVVSVSFDGLPSDFEDNIKIVEESIQNYVNTLDDSMIEEALKEYEKKYTTIEFDSNSLLSLVKKTAHMRNDHNISLFTHYEFFQSITPEKFKKVVRDTFIAENDYRVIYRDYYLFSGDTTIINLIVFMLIIYLYFTYSHLLLKARGLMYTKREVLFTHRIANRFAGFLAFILIMFLGALSYLWLEYLISKYIMGNVNYLYTLDMPYSIYAEVIVNIISIVLIFIAYRWIVRYYPRLEVTKDTMYILGSNPIVISKTSVVHIEVIPWHIGKFFNILGFTFFFWKPLLKIDTKTNSYYVRSSNAKELREDLIQRWDYISYV